jgi:hypothetical protein
MVSMKQNSKVDEGTRHESGEREPKGAKASDHTGEKRERIVAGVGMGKADRMPLRDAGHIGKHEGLVGEHNEGRQTSGTCYDHKRTAYRREDRTEGQKE